MRKQNFYERSRRSHSTAGSVRFGVTFFLGPALGLVGGAGSEHTFLGRGRRLSRLDLGGGGARVGLFLAAWLTVSMTNDLQEAHDVVPVLAVRAGAGATSVRPGAVGEALELTWSNELAH